MPVALTTPNNEISGLISGFGCFAIVHAVWTGNYTTGGVVFNLATVFPGGTIHGGHVVADTLNDGCDLWRCIVPAGATSASAVVMMYGIQTGADGPLIERSNGVSMSHVTGQDWLFMGW